MHLDGNNRQQTQSALSSSNRGSGCWDLGKEAASKRSGNGRTPGSSGAAAHLTLAQAGDCVLCRGSPEAALERCEGGGGNLSARVEIRPGWGVKGVNGFAHKYVVIATTTKSILLDPFGFGSTIGDTIDDTKRAALYLFEGFVFFYALYMLFAESGPDLPFSNLPFSGEILAAVLVASTALTALIAHPLARMFSSRHTSVHGSLACFFYWGGYCLFVIPPLFAILIMGAQWLFGVLSLPEDVRLLIMMVVMVPILFVYYVGTICSWIGRVYDIEPVVAGIAIAISYTLFMGVGAGVAALASLAFGTGS